MYYKSSANNKEFDTGIEIELKSKYKNIFLINLQLDLAVKNYE